MKKYSSLSIGLALFTLLFGPGNIIYPLSLGALTGEAFWYALWGFIITAVLMPIVGFVAALLCHGNYNEVLRYLGRVPGAFITFICMLLIGPFCVIPRCIALSYETTKGCLGGMSLGWFSVLASALVLIATVRKELIMPLFGRFFGPIKLILIFGIVVAGVITAPTVPVTQLPAWACFKQGLFDGYGTMDLLGTLFCAGLIATQLQSGRKKTGNNASWSIAKRAAVVGSIGGGILALVYAGFFFVSGVHAEVLQGVGQADMFSVLAHFLLGPVGGILAGIIITLTCLTTAIALSSIVADYIRVHVFAEYFSYTSMLCTTLAIAGFMSNFGFSAIMRVVEPLITVFYPLLIVLALTVILYKLFWNSDVHIVPAHKSEETVPGQHFSLQSKNAHDNV